MKKLKFILGFVMTLSISPHAAGAQNPTELWFSFLAEQPGFLLVFECESLIDEYASDHPDAERTKARLAPIKKLVFAGEVGDLFKMGDIYTLDDLYNNFMYKELVASFREGFEEETGPQDEKNANTVIEVCNKVIEAFDMENW